MKNYPLPMNWTNSQPLPTEELAAWWPKVDGAIVTCDGINFYRAKLAQPRSLSAEQQDDGALPSAMRVFLGKQ